jgi:hypothetical protein
MALVCHLAKVAAVLDSERRSKLIADVVLVELERQEYTRNSYLAATNTIDTRRYSLGRGIASFLDGGSLKSNCT